MKTLWKMKGKEMRYLLMTMGLTMILSGWIVFKAGTNYHPSRDFAKRVSKCFSKSWNVHTFDQAGERLVDKHGNTHFYSCTEVDEAIDELRNYLVETQKQRAKNE